MTPDQIKAWVELAKLPTPHEPTHYMTEDAQYCGYWYVCCESERFVKILGSYYLHSDGIIYEGTLNKATKTSGWFKTKDEADAAIELYYEKLGLELCNGH